MRWWPFSTPPRREPRARGGDHPPRYRQRLDIDAWAGLSASEAPARLERFVCTSEATHSSVACRLGDVGVIVV